MRHSKPDDTPVESSTGGASLELFRRVAESPSIDPAELRALATAQRDEAQRVGRSFGKYSIIERLGAGGMGVVYKAHDGELDRVVALKLVRAEHASDERRRRMLTREARIAARITHPRIATIYDCAEIEGVILVVMEYLHGHTLREVLCTDGIDLRQALRYALEIAEGLAAAHEGGVIHRDLKPDNVMVVGGRVKILDFGVAKLADSISVESASEATTAGHVLGTRGYMSPEQMAGRKVDARTDVYAFGVLLAEMMDGRPDGTAADNSKRRRAMRVATKCMAVKSDDRFADGAALVAALQPLSAREEMPGSTRRRWIAIAVGITAATMAGAMLYRYAALQIKGANDLTAMTTPVPAEITTTATVVAAPPSTTRPLEEPRATAPPPPVQGSSTVTKPSSATPSGAKTGPLGTSPAPASTPGEKESKPPQTPPWTRN